MSKLVMPNRDSDKLRISLIGNLLWSPHDFIQAIPPEHDKALYVDALCRDLDEIDDLRSATILPPPRAVPAAVFAERLPWDSAFFGYGVAKLHGVIQLAHHTSLADYSGAIRQLCDEARRRDIRYLFASVDSRDLALTRALGQVGFSLIETRVYHWRSLKDYAYPEHFPVRAATAADIESLGTTAQKTVNPYDRFHADPFIKPEDAERLMYQWVVASINEGFADVTIVPDMPDPAAFVTVRYLKDKWDAWGIKMGQIAFVAVSQERKGWYRKLVSEVAYHLQAMGIDYVYNITQIDNRAVIHVLESLGFSFGRSEYTFRILL